VGSSTSGAAPRLYLVTDRRATGGRPLASVIDAALAAVPAGGAWVQLRERDLGGRELVALARELRAVAHAHGGRLFVNDRVDVALAAQADGVQLPEHGLPVAVARELMPDGAIGVSRHAPDGLRCAGADFVVLGPIWDTPAKRPFGPPLGVGSLAAACGALPVIAIGGIDGPARARQARRAGAAGVAVIRAVMAAEDPGCAARALYEAAA
jgi:thiamine-phosphate pyrophosphorylase